MRESSHSLFLYMESSLYLFLLLLLFVDYSFVEICEVYNKIKKNKYEMTTFAVL